LEKSGRSLTVVQPRVCTRHLRGFVRFASSWDAITLVGPGTPGFCLRDEQIQSASFRRWRPLCDGASAATTTPREMPTCFLRGLVFSIRQPTSRQLRLMLAQSARGPPASNQRNVAPASSKGRVDAQDSSNLKATSRQVRRQRLRGLIGKSARKRSEACDAMTKPRAGSERELENEEMRSRFGGGTDMDER
jgi:hypothetical protein